MPAVDYSPPDTPKESNPSVTVSLAELAELAVACVLEVRAEADDAARLKAMGLCVGRRVQLVQQGDPLILRAIGMRIGLSQRLAECIFVELIVEPIDVEPNTAATLNSETNGPR